MIIVADLKIGSESNENEIRVLPTHLPIPVKKRIPLSLIDGQPNALFIYERLENQNKLLAKVLNLTKKF